MQKNGEENRVYEYFRTEEVFFTGKHRNYVDALWTQNKIKESYVERLIDIYMMSVAIGLRTGRKAEEDRVDEQKRTIQTKQLNDNISTLMNLMRMVLILDESRNLSVEQRIEEAFRIPETFEEYKRNMDLFNSYARGGIEILYEELILKPVDMENDYGDAKISNIVAFMKNPLEYEGLI